MDVAAFLEKHLRQAEKLVSNKKELNISKDLANALNEIISKSESAKGVLTVVLTSLVYKILHPEQDIRKHQASIDGGYSGRSFDSQNITPFLKQNKFPAMAESGWLTRSLEQKVPYDKDYTGAIRPQQLKVAFLNTIDYIQQSSDEDRILLLQYIFAQLLIQRERITLPLATPRNLSISQLLELLEKHFTSKYSYDGAARLPVLAMYSIYLVMMQEVRRFQYCKLLELENHTSADRQSGRLGDIDIVDNNNEAFEAVEVKFQIPITLSILDTAYDKFVSTGIKRYYILSTSPISSDAQDQLHKRIQEIKNIHGCQVIINGIYSTLRYYLRLIEDPAQFISKYTELLSSDKTIKYEHKLRWNNLVALLV